MKFRRARPLACYWAGERLIAWNYHTGQRSFLPALAADILGYCDTWRTTSEISAKFTVYPVSAIRELLSVLATSTMLDRSARGKQDDAFAEWSDWMPHGAFFHFATKDVEYAADDRIIHALVRKAKQQAPPAATKRYRGARRTALPPIDELSLNGVLTARRTWRSFGARGVPLASVATLLGLTWGVQRWMTTRIGTVALKTSPSGGARHPIEAYMFARNVAGLARGWYHYDADGHALERVGSRGAVDQGAYLPNQPAFRSVPALFVMAAVFARTRWAYANARAYRVVLLDAGHLGQTFCLVATALRLAPFCSAALADTRIERDLGLDGIAESVLYACGVGMRPPGVKWAPAGNAALVPRVSLPKSTRRASNR